MFYGLRSNCNRSSISCQHCIYYVSQIHINDLYCRLEDNTPIKEDHHSVWFPFEVFLIVVSLINNLSLILIFEKQFHFFLFSNFFILLTLMISDELFIDDQPNVNSTLFIRVSVLFLKSFFVIGYDQTIIENLHSINQNENSLSEKTFSVYSINCFFSPFVIRPRISLSQIRCRLNCFPIYSLFFISFMCNISIDRSETWSIHCSLINFHSGLEKRSHYIRLTVDLTQLTIRSFRCLKFLLDQTDAH